MWNAPKCLSVLTALVAASFTFADRLTHTADKNTLLFVKCLPIYMSRRLQLMNTEAHLQAVGYNAATQLVFKLLGFSSQSVLASGLLGCLEAID